MSDDSHQSALAAGLALLVSVAAGFGCGPEDDQASGDLTYEEMSSSYAETLGCEKVPACESLAGLGIVYEPYCHPDSPGLPFRSVDVESNDRVAFDAEAGRKCLDAVESMSACEIFSSDDLAGGACSNYVRGTQSEGDACLRDVECEGELDCHTSGTCPGTCRGRLAEGEECGRGGRLCAEELYCDETCKARKAEGADCSISYECRDDLFCGDDGCRTKKSAGASCEGPGQCGEGLRCSDEGVCADPASSGGTCATSADCSGHRICIDESCQTGHAEGESCRPLECRPGLRCADGACIPVAKPGESCESSKNCVLSHYCDEGTCRPRPTLGDDCSDPPEAYEDGELALFGLQIPFCYRGECVDGTCQKQQPGEACTSPGYHFEPCENGYCQTSERERSGTCRAYKSEGESCSNDEACGTDSTCESEDDSDADVCREACTIE